MGCTWGMGPYVAYELWKRMWRIFTVSFTISLSSHTFLSHFHFHFFINNQLLSNICQKFYWLPSCFGRHNFLFYVINENLERLNSRYVALFFNVFMRNQEVTCSWFGIWVSTQEHNSTDKTPVPSFKLNRKRIFWKERE